MPLRRGSQDIAQRPKMYRQQASRSTNRENYPTLSTFLPTRISLPCIRRQIAVSSILTSRFKGSISDGSVIGGPASRVPLLKSVPHLVMGKLGIRTGDVPPRLYSHLQESLINSAFLRAGLYFQRLFISFLSLLTSLVFTPVAEV